MARGFRFGGRVLLAVGTIILAGMVMMMLYAAFSDAEVVDVVVPDSVPGGSSVGSGAVRTSGVIWSGLIVIAVTVGMIFTFRRLNAFMRGVVVKIAKFMRMSILGTELGLSAVVWGLVGVILALFFPIGEIAAAGFLVLNLLCYVLAWLLYGRPKYKL